MGVVVACKGFHLMLVELQDVCAGEDTFLLLEIDGNDLLADHFPEIALYINRDGAFRRQVLHDICREVIGKQAAKVEDPGLKWPHIVDGEGVRLCQHTLLAVV